MLTKKRVKGTELYIMQRIFVRPTAIFLLPNKQGNINSRDSPRSKTLLVISSILYFKIRYLQQRLTALSASSFSDLFFSPSLIFHRRSISAFCHFETLYRLLPPDYTFHFFHCSFLPPSI